MKKIFIYLAIVVLSITKASSQRSAIFPNSTATYATAANHTALNAAANESITITAWIKTSTATNQLILCKRLNGAGTGYEIWQMNGYLAVNCTHNNGASSGVPGGSRYKINDGKWHHIAFVIDIENSKYILYVDGKSDTEKALISTTGVTNTQPLIFGLRSGNTMPLNGYLDEVRIYKKALSFDDLMTDMAANVTSATSHLSAAWNFEEESGTTAADIKGTCNATFSVSPARETLSAREQQSISMSNTINLPFGSPDFSPATNSSSMPVEYSTSDAAVATVINGKIRITGRGSCTITAGHSGNLYYAPATPVTQTLNVLKTNITFDTPFTNNAVIQRDEPVVVSGTAEPNDVLTVILDGEEKTANVNAAGKWFCTFSAKPAKNTAFTLSAEGENSQQKTLTNLLCGDVWVAAGQSNMLMPVGPGFSLGGILNYSTVIATANYSNIRFIQPVDLWQQAPTPQTSLKALSDGWTVCSSATTGGYSAVAYFFAKQIHLDQNIPIGIIQNAVGGTRIEAWTPLEGLKAVTEYSSWYTKATTTTMESGQTYNRKNFPTANYNGMLAPFTANKIKGIIWYQGEENLAIDGTQYIKTYGNKFKATIEAWRNAWKQPDLPVIYSELANFKYSMNYASLGGSREALPVFVEQQRKATELENVFGITISDISNYNDIHPTNKAPLGMRMGNAALGKIYGKTGIEPLAATFREMRSEGRALRISFNNNSGLKINSGTVLNEFKIAGRDKVFKTAMAVISGNDVLVSEPTIAQPLSVKFAYDENANPNLFNASNSPAARFADSLKYNLINFESIPANLEPGQTDVLLDARATSGINVAFTSSNNEIAEVVNEKYLHIKTVGEVTITAYEPGNTVWAAALPVSQTVKIAPSSTQGIKVEDVIIQHSGNATDIIVKGLSVDTMIEIVSANGSMVTSQKTQNDVFTISLPDLTGVFLLKISNANQQFVHKFRI